MIEKPGRNGNRRAAGGACMMSARVKSKYIWFRLTILFGLGLGVLLLVQTVVTYRHVANVLVRQEAGREVDRRMQSIGRAARLTGTRDPVSLTPVLHELVHEAPQRIAWIRIVSRQGKVIAESEPVPGAPMYVPGQPVKMMNNRGGHPEERTTPSGPVLIVLNPLRLGRPPFQRPPGDPAARIGDFPEGREPDAASTNLPSSSFHPPPPRPLQQEFVEIAIYLNGISTNFGLLRENLILGCWAAVALMGAMIVLGLRFPHYMRGKRVEEELSLARRVQNDLFPTDSLAGNIPFAARCVPALQVGGDLYDVFDTDDGEIALVLGDVSGKGLPAALLMGVVQGAVRASSGSGAAANHEQAAERLNHLLCMKTARERFVSLFWCYFDRQSSVLRYINAGHLPPLLIRSDGSEPKIVQLDQGGPVLGLLPGARYSQAQVEVHSGDLLVVYSDGILEAENARGEDFGEAGVIASIARHSRAAPAEICAAVLEDVRIFLGAELPQDDQTLLIARLDRVGATLIERPPIRSHAAL